ncbi:MAG: DUF2946 family protein [Gammaproteobacteria bacterium]|nr:DUF2946 family protein [Gammaproteobacteria bacterium]
MSIIGRNRQLVLVAALATLALRALTPDGYMPGSADSGLLYELCPEGMPVEIMQALAGDNQHHHHHGGDSEAASASSSEQCPIGHMLASAIAMDSTPASDMLPAAPSYNDGSVAVLFHTPAIGYRSRAPPA